MQGDGSESPIAGAERNQKMLWASVFQFVSRQLDTSLKTTSKNYRNKLEKLFERQDKPLGGRKRAIS